MDQGGRVRGATRHRHVGTAALLAAVLATAGCGSRTETAQAEPRLTPVATADSSPSPSPSPTPPPEPVQGERLTRSVDVGDGALLGPDDRGEVDEAAIAAFSEAVFTWLDEHLTDLQGGGDGLLALVLAEGLAPDDPAVVPALTTALASPSLTVTTARYELTAFHDAGPQFATVAVALSDGGGSTRSATLAFAASTDGRPVLVLGEPEVTP